MEKRFLKYTMLLVIFFFGLSMGVSYQQTSHSDQIQKEVDQFEDEITTPNNDFTPTNPNDDYKRGNANTKIEENIFTSIGKDGEFIIKKGISLVLDKSDDLFKMLFA